MQDSLSDDALMPLKSYKYQSVDKSFISRYVLKHYVLRLWKSLLARNPMLIPRCLVECIRRAVAALVGTQHGDSSGVLLHYWECDFYRNIYAGSRGPGKDNC